VDFLADCLAQVPPEGQYPEIKDSLERNRAAIYQAVGGYLWQKELDLRGPLRQEVRAWLHQPAPAPGHTITYRVAQALTAVQLIDQLRQLLHTPGRLSVRDFREVLEDLLEAASGAEERAVSAIEELVPQVTRYMLSRRAQTTADSLLSLGNFFQHEGYWRAAREAYRSAQQLAPPGATRARAVIGEAAIEMDEGNYEAHDRRLELVLDAMNAGTLDPLTAGEALLQRGKVRYYRGLYGLALRDFARARAISLNFDKNLQSDASVYLGRVNYELAVATADRLRMNDALQLVLESKAIGGRVRRFFHLRWEALCKEWLGQHDDVINLRSEAAESSGSYPDVTHLWLDEGARLARDGDVIGAEGFLRRALYRFDHDMEYPKGTADAQRSLAQLYVAQQGTVGFAKALELSFASVLIYPYGGNAGTKQALALLRMLEGAMGGDDFLQHLRNAEEMWRSKQGPFSPLGRIVVDRQAVAKTFLKALKTDLPSSWADALL
jgi:tetratricopeptide (TPR) repeat protein